MRVVELGENHIKNCSKYFPKNEIVEIVHAAICLQENSILITNDKHFDKISDGTDFPHIFYFRGGVRGDLSPPAV